TGDFSSTAASTTTFSEDQTLTNQKLTTVTHRRNGRAAAQTDSSGNAFTGAYTTHRTSSSSADLSQTDTNQVNVITTTGTDSAGGPSTETGNSVTGSYDVTSSGTSSLSKTEVNAVGPTSTIAQVSTGTSTEHRSGSHTDGDFTFTGTDADDTTQDETFSYLS